MGRVQLERFRKVVKTKDGAIAVLRPLVAEDREKLLSLFRGLSEAHRRFLRNDVADSELVAQWTDKIDYDSVFPLVAQVDEEIVADATLHRLPGAATQHVGEIRIVIGDRLQGKGLGRIMLEEMISLAEKLGLEQLMAQIPVDSTVAHRAFEKVGFRREAIFKDFFKSADGEYHDVAILFLVLKERWEEF